ncbi:unnamed protein product [Ectocarpus sp. 12 AP-2014]
MQSLVLVDDYSRPAATTAGPAKGDRSLLPLGLISKPPAAEHGSGGNNNNNNNTAAGRPQRPTGEPPSDSLYVRAEGCPSTLPPPPAGPPVMVLFPATLPLSIFLAPPPPATLASGVLTLLAILGSWGWGWGLVSAGGVGSGLAAGLAAGLGVRSRPVGGWGFTGLSALGTALLGGGKASLTFGMSLALSTLWRHGWWLYVQPECAPVLFLLSGTTADVALGFLLTSLIQIHRSPSPPPPPRSESQGSSRPQASAAAAHHQHASGSQADMWNAVTPPGLAGLRGRRT